MFPEFPESSDVLTILGPSGAGKTALINALTLEAVYGTCSGSITLNGVRLTGKLFKQHAYVVKQRDKNWPNLSCREILTYTARLYDVDTQNTVEELVKDVIAKMGLTGCANKRCYSLSAGESRRLLIATALLKNPSLLFLDKPTAGKAKK